MAPSLFRAAALAALLAAPLASPAAAVEPDPLFPQFGNPGYDVQSYNLKIDATNLPAIRGVATLAIQSEARLASFALDLNDTFKVASVVIDGRPAAHRFEGDKLVVTPARPIARRTLFTVQITYRGKPQALPDPTFPNPEGELGLGWLTYGADKVYALSEPIGASSWYPCNDVPTDKATFRVAVTVPEGRTAVSNGNLLAVNDRGDDREFVWRMNEPMTTWLATMHINEFRLVEDTYKRLPLRYYLTRAVTDEQLEAFLQTRPMLRFMEQTVGKYPFDAYGSVVVDDPRLYYALETAAMSTFPSDFIDIGVVMHELAHQWFGNAVTVERWEDIWLAEGFATYFEVLFPDRDDRDAFDEQMRQIHAYIVRENVGPAVISEPTDLFATAVYYRGAVALYALQLKVGDEAFYNTVRAWYGTYDGRNASTGDFIALAAQTTGDESVVPFLTEWLYDQDVPPLPGEPPAAAGAARQAERADLGAAIVRAHGAHHRHGHARYAPSN